MKRKFYIGEVQKIQQIAALHRIIECDSLTTAKRIASREKKFQGTILVIEDEEGKRLAYKENNVWHDEDDRLQEEKNYMGWE